MLSLKKFIIVILCALYMVGCGKEKDDVLHLGLNAKIVEIDSDKHIIYVSDMNGNIEKVFDYELYDHRQSHPCISGQNCPESSKNSG